MPTAVSIGAVAAFAQQRQRQGAATGAPAPNSSEYKRWVDHFRLSKSLGGNSTLAANIYYKVTATLAAAGLTWGQLTIHPSKLERDGVIRGLRHSQLGNAFTWYALKERDLGVRFAFTVQHLDSLVALLPRVIDTVDKQCAGGMTICLSASLVTEGPVPFHEGCNGLAAALDSASCSSSEDQLQRNDRN